MYVYVRMRAHVSVIYQASCNESASSAAVPASLFWICWNRSATLPLTKSGQYEVKKVTML